MSHTLVIPENGLIEIIHETDNEGLLKERGEGTYIRLYFNNIKIEFLSNAAGAVNLRARSALVQVDGPHIILTGTVCMTGLTEDEVVEVIRRVG